MTLPQPMRYAIFGTVGLLVIAATLVIPVQSVVVQAGAAFMLTALWVAVHD